MPKTSALKWGKFVKKTLDDKQYFMCKVTGKFPAKLTREIKSSLNDTLSAVMVPEPIE